MPLACIKVPSFMGLRGVLQNRGHDFWIGCLAGATEWELPEKVGSVQVDRELAEDAFSHCYYQASKDIGSDTHAIISEFGLGLRRKTTRSQSVPGCIYALVSNDGPSLLSKRRATLSSIDTKLSAEERLRRSQLQFAKGSESDLRREAEANRGRFWITAYSDIDAETTKKRIITAKVEGRYTSELFTHCLLHETRDCFAVTERFSMLCGLGLRSVSVRSRPGPGCVALLGDHFGHSIAKSKQESFPAKSLVKESASSEVVTPKRDRKSPPSKDAQMDPSPVPAQRPPPSRAESHVFPHPLPLCPPCRPSGSNVGLPDGAQSPPSSKREPAQPEIKRRRVEERGVAPANAATTPPSFKPQQSSRSAFVETVRDPEGERYFRQIQVLEGKLGSLLPSLPQDQLSTPFVQAHLENFMNQPPGRLHKFKNEIGRIWRAFLVNQQSTAEPLA